MGFGLKLRALEAFEDVLGLNKKWDAWVAELVYAQVSKTCGGNSLWVRSPPQAPISNFVGQGSPPPIDFALHLALLYFQDKVRVEFLR